MIPVSVILTDNCYLHKKKDYSGCLVFKNTVHEKEEFWWFAGYLHNVCKDYKS